VCYSSRLSGAFDRPAEGGVGRKRSTGIGSSSITCRSEIADRPACERSLGRLVERGPSAGAGAESSGCCA